MAEIVERTMDALAGLSPAATIEDVYMAEAEARRAAARLFN
jgi:1-deoxy-D-xylulose-5-phosphate reductoisomerase